MTAPLTPFFITGYSKGFQTNKKPFLLPDQAWSTLENSYTFRERMLKREGNTLLGRLQRDLTGQSLGATVGAQTTYTFTDIFTTLSLRGTEPNAEIRPGTLVINIDAPDMAKFTDNGDGTFTVTGVGVAAGSYVDYATGKVVINITASVGGGAIRAAFSYFPGLPGMGIWQQELSAINAKNTIWWDTKYAYIYVSPDFKEFIPGTNWNGTNSNFFWAYNYQGANLQRLLFVTNFFYVSRVNFDPLYYTDGNTWTVFTPKITATQSLFQARIIIPYYNRLIALNTWEGLTDKSVDATNFYARCRFSALGNPTGGGSPDTGGNAWRQDIFGQGGFLDAPTADAITGATFVENTLVVDFENSTWQLRYIGEYGAPFIWERVSRDFGSGSTFSGVLLGNKRLNVSSLALTESNSVSVDRIDVEIPDQVFDFQSNATNNGALRVWGVRDYQKELVFWCYPDSQNQAAPGVDLIYPNKVLLFNYRNASYSIFRDNVTAFGLFLTQAQINWSSTTVFWDDEEVTWDDDINQKGFQAVVKLNQEGFAHMFGYQTQDDPSLSITGAALSTGALQLTVPNHNLISGEIVLVTGMMFIDSSTFLPVSTSLNNTIFLVQVIDANTIQLYFWNTIQQAYIIVGTTVGDFTFTPDLTASIYIGGGELTLFPKLNMITKDINLFQRNGLQTKMSRIDFLIEPQPDLTAVTCNIILNSTPLASANITITPTNFQITENTNYNYTTAADYQWFSFYQTLSSQYFRIQLTFDDDLMNTLTTHQSNMTLYAINAWTRPGGRFAGP